jgi:hypothetical protein
MPQAISNLRPDPILTNIAAEFGAGPGFIVNQLVPLRGVPNQFYRYAVWDVARIKIQQEVETLHAAGARANRARAPQLTWATHTISDYALEEAITDKERSEAPSGMNIDRVRTEKITTTLRMAREIAFRDLIINTGTIANATPAVHWDAAAAVVIEANIDAAKEAFILQCGFSPTHIVVPPQVAVVMKRDPTIRGLIRWTNDSLLVNGDLPPTVFGMKVVIPGAITNTAAPGAAAAVARIWNTDRVILLYVNPAAASDPAAMTAVFGAYTTYGPGGQDLAIETQRDPVESTKSDLITGYTSWDMVLNASCAYIIDDTLT